jgi:hypothetical protein
MVTVNRSVWLLWLLRVLSSSAVVACWALPEAGQPSTEPTITVARLCCCCLHHECKAISDDDIQVHMSCVLTAGANAA